MQQYVVLLPVLEEGEEDDGEVVILKVENTDEASVLNTVSQVWHSQETHEKKT